MRKHGWKYSVPERSRDIRHGGSSPHSGCLIPPARTPRTGISLAPVTWRGKPGLILVEAKANIPELGRAGKPISPDASKNSQENHERIGHAIAEARTGLSTVKLGIAISHASQYQRSNRLAFARNSPL